MPKRIIWTAEYDTSDEAIAKARIDGEDSGLLLSVDATDDEVLTYLSERNSDWRDDEVSNLSVTISNPILVIADLGLWHGRKQGYRILHPKTVGEILYMQTSDYYPEFYADAYNVYCRDPYLDGTNYYLFRELIADEDSDAVIKLLNTIYDGKDYTTLMRRYTRSILPYVADVYGWPCAARRKKAV